VSKLPLQRLQVQWHLTLLKLVQFPTHHLGQLQQRLLQHPQLHQRLNQSPLRRFLQRRLHSLLHLLLRRRLRRLMLLLRSLQSLLHRLPPHHPSRQSLHSLLLLIQEQVAFQTTCLSNIAASEL
jgi:hypothetical protein